MNAFRIQSVLGIFFVVLAMLFVAACKTGEPGVRNQAGTVTTRLDHPPDVIVTATKKAVDELKLTLISSKATKLDGEVVARTAQGENVVVTVERETDTISKVWIRVGTTGDQDVSMTLLDKIKENLKPIQRILP